MEDKRYAPGEKQPLSGAAAREICRHWMRKFDAEQEELDRIGRLESQRRLAELQRRRSNWVARGEI